MELEKHSKVRNVFFLSFAEDYKMTLTLEHGSQHGRSMGLPWMALTPEFAYLVSLSAHPTTS